MSSFKHNTSIASSDLEGMMKELDLIEEDFDILYQPVVRDYHSSTRNIIRYLDNGFTHSSGEENR